jgi:hypothetical protein
VFSLKKEENMADVSIPTTYHIDFDPQGTHQIDAGLDEIRVKELPTLVLGGGVSLNSWPTNELKVGDLSASLTAWPENELKTNIAPISLGITDLPDVNLRLKEIPDTRAHLPAHFEVGFCVLGFKLFSISLCGEAQVITEPYVPHRMELCP